LTTPAGRAASRTAPVELELTLRGVPIDEALVHYVRESAGKLSRIAGPAARWHVRIQATASGARPSYEVAIEVAAPAARISLRHADPDEFLAVRDAFDLVNQQLDAPPEPVASAN